MNTVPETPESHQAAARWNARRQSWLEYLTRLSGAVELGRELPLGPSAEPLRAPAAPAPAGAPSKIVICAPHPDDEGISGALALRLLREAGASVTNVAITLGSDRAQQPRRLGEAQSACRALGFKLRVAGFEAVSSANRREHPVGWRAKVDALRAIFDEEAPDAVLAPHADDFNTAHVGTHLLVQDALGEHLERSRRAPVLLVETEIWHQMERPNLMLGLAPDLVAAQMVGIAEHGGEMRRNPFHLLHPCRLMDNVRRGSEVVGGEGAAGRDFVFAEIYNIARMHGRERVAAPPRGVMIAPTQPFSLNWLAGQFWDKP